MKVHVILVRTETSGNIGSAARALANMGGERLILIEPRCNLDDSAAMMAAGATEKLKSSKTYPSWSDFYRQEGDGLRIAFSRRGGRKRKVLPFSDILAEIAEPQNIYLIFGPEKDGLDSSDLAFVNFTCHLPVYGEMASLNLAQAVLLALFMLRQRWPPSTKPQQLTSQSAESVQPFYFPDELIKKWLEAMGFDVSARRSSAYLTLKRLLLQNLPTRHEIQVLEAILNQNIRKLNSTVLAAKEITDNSGDISSKNI